MVQTTTNYQEASQFLHPFWPSWYASNWPVSYSQTLTVYPTLRHNSWLNLSTQCPRLIKWQAGTHRSGTEDDGTLRDPCKTRMNWPGDAQQAEATPYLGKQLLGIQLGVLCYYLGDKAFKGRNGGHSRSHWGVVAVLRVNIFGFTLQVVDNQSLPVFWTLSYWPRNHWDIFFSVEINDLYQYKEIFMGQLSDFTYIRVLTVKYWPHSHFGTKISEDSWIASFW